MLGNCESDSLKKRTDFDGLDQKLVGALLQTLAAQVQCAGN